MQRRGRRRRDEEELAEELAARGGRAKKLAGGASMETAFIAQNFVAADVRGRCSSSCCRAIPVAFALAASRPVLRLHRHRSSACSAATLFQALPLRMFGIMQNDTLLAIPFFTLMGIILERSGMAEDLLETIGQVFGPVRGGLAYRGDPGRRAARRHHRRGRRGGHLDGPDLAADHAALRLQPHASPPASSPPRARWRRSSRRRWC